ncbi:type VI secretion system baseplate subunit TssF [Sansalvadorimonas sp. 2012CJ34-2]|uniref:Type VI secretion system baseplate subunit TssF n=1 Tax=Parendozoicomonas callyspongiae TaxID=2942213 RepID=A0ABT0PID7_9GAMM|nr:type VI secretion system baseplate subunit TssF [Sansalvadorimonas sp. 2012CJ34-2]
MTDSLLQYYSRELEFIRRRARQFSEAHPGTASRLGMAGEHIADPHMERLLESVAFLNARLEMKLDDSYPQLAESLLKIMFPHYLRSFPSMGLAHISPDKTLKQISHLPAGTRLEARGEDGSLVFTTAWDMQLTPLSVTFAELKQAPLDFSPKVSASAMLHLRLCAADTDLHLATLGLDSLSFHFDGEPAIRRALNDLVHGQLAGIIISGSGAGEGRYLPVEKLAPVGGSRYLLPKPAVSFGGYQQLMEVMAFPDPFLGFTLNGLKNLITTMDCQELNVYLLLREAPPEFSRSVSAQRFRTGCVPVVNLFKCQAEPLILNYGRMRDKVIPDAQAGDTLEVWSIEKVTDLTHHDHKVVPPLYGHNFNASETGLYWLDVGGRDPRGTFHTYLSISDVNYNPLVDDRRVFAIDTWCSNGNRPRALASGTHLECIDNIELPGIVRLMDSPTPRRLSPQGYEAAWALLSHLQLNYEGLFASNSPEQSMRLLIRLYMRGQCPDGNAWIEAIRTIAVEPVTAPVYLGGRHCLSRGRRVLITLDPEPLRETSFQLFIQTLDQLAASYASFDSFLQVAVVLQGQHGVHTQCHRHQARQAGL